LKSYEEYFNLPYPLPKTGWFNRKNLAHTSFINNIISISADMVAVPDFNAGAMENWGLIVYRETAMLYDPTVSSSSNLQRVATVVGN
jgi:aminopeptidase N